MTDQQLIAELEAQQKLMISVATGCTDLQGACDVYCARREEIRSNLNERGLADPNPHEDLWDWYRQWSCGELPTHRSRREYVTELYSTVVARIGAAVSIA
jgi:hypothetical protein